MLGGCRRDSLEPWARVEPFEDLACLAEALCFALLEQV
jgi:hypothetical protein